MLWPGAEATIGNEHTIFADKRTLPPVWSVAFRIVTQKMQKTYTVNNMALHDAKHDIIIRNAEEILSLKCNWIYIIMWCKQN